jgi:hypothetical protein
VKISATIVANIETREENMPRVAVRFGSLVAGLTVALAGLTGAASAAPVANAAAQQAASNAMHAQLARAPGGTIQGDSIIYGAEHVTVKYIPKTAQGARAALDDFCSDGLYLCLYKYTEWGTQVLETGSRWCPREGTAHLYLSHYGLWGQVQSAINNTDMWARMFWEDSWGFRGAQWTLPPWGAVGSASDAHNDWVETCNYSDDLDRSDGS